MKEKRVILCVGNKTSTIEKLKWLDFHVNSVVIHEVNSYNDAIIWVIENQTSIISKHKTVMIDYINDQNIRNSKNWSDVRKKAVEYNWDFFMKDSL